MKTVNGVKTPKTIEKMDDEDKEKMTLNSKAKNVLTCALGKNEYSRVSSCASAHEMWKLLEMTHEGASQVKNYKINLLMSKYKNLKFILMNPLVKCFTSSM